MASIRWRLTLLAGSAAVLLSASPVVAGAITFQAGSIVISTVQNVAPGAPNSSLDTASPITLSQFTLGLGGKSAVANGTLVLPQAGNGANVAISGEYGSASEGILQNSVDGHSLTIVGHGVNAATFNSAAGAGYGSAALGQSTSVTGGANTVVPRVVALVGADGSVDTSTALTGVFNQNNPRSAATVDGSSFYVAGQGVTGDGTGGVFLAVKGATTATAINANTTTPTGSATVSPLTATEARVVEIANTGGGNQLYVSRDFSPSGTPNDSSDIRSLSGPGGALPTSATGLAAARVIDAAGSSLSGNTSSINLTAALDNSVNSARNGKFVYLSSEQFFYANATTLYVADSGSPKNGSAGAAGLGEGGLQKWSLVGGTWVLDYVIYDGLNLVNNATKNSATPTANGVTGLFGLAGQVEADGTVQLFATSYGLNELSQSYLYEVTDTLANTTPVATTESFTTLYSAAAGTDIRGVAFAPVPEPASLALLGAGAFGAALLRRRRAR